MTEYYILIVGLLAVLAISDLIVGVANDAVNFLNSAIGSKVAPRHIILLVASIGVFVGATFSSGMMEVARKGIFHPDAFFFSDLMIIFMAVMLADIFLLDLFNTFGLPTSTTVSIVFDLLGASVAVALLKINQSGEGLGALNNYINSASALAIITGILASIVVSFVVGTLLQYLSRLLFTFQYERRMKWVGGLWTGFALALLSHFLLFKGIKGASFVSDEFIKWVGDNIMTLFLGAFVFWSVLMQILLSVFKVNILRIVVLFGTFSLAMAFAGNDLVNFIGVPIAGFESYKAWSASGAGPSEFTMEILRQPVRTDTILLVIAGAIMVATLWRSKKARTVTATSVDLSRQDEGIENFNPNALSKFIVRYSRAMANGLQAVIPQSVIDRIEKNFAQDELPNDADKPAFDLVRASVNLTVASALIAFATSLKLPLSTTYVTFMVAMGTSLSDRAWGRDSAVYRIAGVMNVIGGWFVTALVAFVVSALCALLIYSFGGWAIGILFLALGFFIYRTFILHRKNEKEKEVHIAFEQQTATIPPSKLIENTSKRVANTLRLISMTYQTALSGLIKEKLDLTTRAKEELRDLKKENEKLKKRLFRAIQRVDETSTEASQLYLRVYDLQQDILESTGFIVKACSEHVENSLKPLKPEQVGNLKTVMKLVDDYMNSIIELMENHRFLELDGVLGKKSLLLAELDRVLSEQIEGIKRNSYGKRNSLLVFSIKLETKDMVAVAARFLKLYSRVQQGQKKE